VSEARARKADELLYAEDFRSGMEFAFGSVTLTEEDMTSFARQWDPQCFHVDRAAAADSPWGRDHRQWLPDPRGLSAAGGGGIVEQGGGQGSQRR
jgi:acyl dehydratase